MARVWKIAPGEHADHWEMCRERDCILLGWRALANYKRFTSEAAILKALGGGPGDGKGAAKSIWRFANEIKPFDIVVANHGRGRIVGIGVIKSDYLPPRSPRNPSTSKWLPHARLVDWTIQQSIDLEPLFFAPPTVHALSQEKVSEIRRVYSTAYPKLKNAVDKVLASASFDNRDVYDTMELLASVENQFSTEDFDPTSIADARTRILSSIVRRQGQPAFRKKLLLAYNRRCAISGCAVEAVLEAAHIVPYKGEITNHIANGILLRGDFHTLFDLRLIAIDATTMRLLVSTTLNGPGYENYRGKKVRMPNELGCKPSREALDQHRYETGLGYKADSKATEKQWG